MERGELKLRHVPTETMIADIFTKPNGRILFEKLAAKIMGDVSLDEYDLSSDSVAHGTSSAACNPGHVRLEVVVEPLVAQVACDNVHPVVAGPEQDVKSTTDKSRKSKSVTFQDGLLG